MPIVDGLHQLNGRPEMVCTKGRYNPGDIKIMSHDTDVVKEEGVRKVANGNMKAFTVGMCILVTVLIGCMFRQHSIMEEQATAISMVAEYSLENRSVILDNSDGVQFLMGMVVTNEAP